jgi:hypothetical protein
MLQHLLRVGVRYQKTDVISLDCFPPQNEKALRSLRQKSGEFVDENLFDFVCLFDADRDTNRVDGWLDKYFLVLVAGDGQRR